MARLIAHFLRFFFHLLYHPLAWAYDFVAAAVSLGQWKDWVMSVQPFLRGTRILELGHGPGHLQLALSARRAAIFGVDASPQMGRLTQRRLQKKQRSCHITNGRAQTLPFPNNHFDHVVATFPAEYSFHTKTFQEVHRVLVPGGTFVLLPIAWITGKTIHARGAAWLFRITGQAPPQDVEIPLGRFEQAGLQAQVHTIVQSSWTVVIITAKKR